MYDIVFYYRKADLFPYGIVGAWSLGAKLSEGEFNALLQRGYSLWGREDVPSKVLNQISDKKCLMIIDQTFK